MRIAHVSSWKCGGEWLGWLVIGRNGKVAARIPKDDGGGQMRSHAAAQAFAEDLNVGGARRERRLRETAA